LHLRYRSQLLVAAAVLATLALFSGIWLQPAPPDPAQSTPARPPWKRTRIWRPRSERHQRMHGMQAPTLRPWPQHCHCVTAVHGTAHLLQAWCARRTHGGASCCSTGTVCSMLMQASVSETP
jgi:hypothetical protein